jgi:hypothetical protein
MKGMKSMKRGGEFHHEGHEEHEEGRGTRKGGRRRGESTTNGTNVREWEGEALFMLFMVNN